MKIKKITGTDSKDIAVFSNFAREIYQNNPQWVPHLAGEIENSLDRRKNPFFQHSDSASFIVKNDTDKTLGRVTVIDNNRFNAYNNTKIGFFTHFECVNDQAAATMLFEQVFRWAQDHQLEKIIGPKGFSPLDGLGLLVKGFQYQPAFGIPYNPDYYSDLIESVGFLKTNDIISGYVTRESSIAEKVIRAAEIIGRRTGLRVARFKSRHELLRLTPKLCNLYNKAIEGTTGNYPITEHDAKLMAHQLLLFSDPKFIKILFKEEEPVGFLFAYPDISRAVQRNEGKVFPFQWLDFLRELKTTRIININGAGIIEEFRGRGGTALLFSEMYKSLIEGDFLQAELVQVGVENDRMQNELRNIGAIFHKVHRMYERKI